MDEASRGGGRWSSELRSTARTVNRGVPMVTNVGDDETMSVGGDVRRQRREERRGRARRPGERVHGLGVELL